MEPLLAVCCHVETGDERELAIGKGGGGSPAAAEPQWGFATEHPGSSSSAQLQGN